VVLPILTRHSAKSDFVLNEIAYALEKKKFIIPIKWDHLLRRPDDWPLNLIRLHFADFTTESLDTALHLLMKALNRTVPDPDDDPTPTPTFAPLDIPQDAAESSGAAKEAHYINEGRDDQQNRDMLLVIDVILPDNPADPATLTFALYDPPNQRASSPETNSYSPDEYEPPFVSPTVSKSRQPMAYMEHLRKITHNYRENGAYSDHVTRGRCLRMADYSISHEHKGIDFVLSEWPDDPKQRDRTNTLMNKMESIVERAFRAAEVSEYEARLCLNNVDPG
jgi:hypothetical protein